MTDNEIIKVLECCLDGDYKKSQFDICSTCPYFSDGNCTDVLKRNALDLINRQKAEIERLCIEIDELIIAKDLLFDEAEALIKKAKAEAIKEFAERLKYKYSIFCRYCGGFIKLEIDNLVKEMVGENND